MADDTHKQWPNSIRWAARKLVEFRGKERVRLEKELTATLAELKVPMFCRKRTRTDQRYYDGINACIEHLNDLWNTQKEEKSTTAP